MIRTWHLQMRVFGDKGRSREIVLVNLRREDIERTQKGIQALKILFASYDTLISCSHKRHFKLLKMLIWAFLYYRQHFYEWYQCRHSTDDGLFAFSMPADFFSNNAMPFPFPNH